MAKKSAPLFTAPQGSRARGEITGKSQENSEKVKSRKTNIAAFLAVSKIDLNADNVASDDGDEIPLEKENLLLTRHQEQLKKACEGGHTALPSEETTAPPNHPSNGQVTTE
eukprot:Seg2993.3 transcript_id=Seg2993.3/GoldUCD/mRNA.D3Y31 product="hypothetical protein" protein_id=Seg2993.3/GoldUCD/D3Y31